MITKALGGETQRLVETGEPSGDALQPEVTAPDTAVPENYSNHTRPAFALPALIVNASIGTKMPHFFVSNSKKISLVLGICIAMVAGVVIYSDLCAKEQSLRKYTAEAALLEYDGQDERAGLVWHRAVKTATQLGGKAKLLADLYVRAARAEGQAAQRIEFKRKRHPADNVRLDREIGEKIDYDRSLQIKDLRTAIRLYERIPDTTAVQIATVERLIRLCREELPELYYASALRNPNAYFQVATYSSVSKATMAWLDLGDKQLVAHPDLALHYYRNYLVKLNDSTAITDKAIALAKTVPQHKDPLARRAMLNSLIPLFHELIYYNQSGPSGLKSLHEWLDWLVQKSGKKPFNLTDRLSLAEQAYSHQAYHGAIVEYLRCLGMSNDQQVREKLIKTLRLCRAADFGESDLAPVYVEALVKSMNLDQQRHGNDHPWLDTTWNKYCLGTAYAIANDFDSSESVLKSLQLDTPRQKFPIVDPPDVYFKLADVYAKEGKWYEAVTQYQTGKKHEKKGKLYAGRFGIWARIANAYIAAGRYAEAESAVERANKDRPNTAFSNGEGLDPANFLD